MTLVKIALTTMKIKEPVCLIGAVPETRSEVRYRNRGESDPSPHHLARVDELKLALRTTGAPAKVITG
ncbi:MAG: hypothetical protein WAM77_17155, partial [Xanthobacteraceae bacterium]